MKKRIIALFAAALMLLSAAACASETADTGADTAASAASEEVEAAAPQEQETERSEVTKARVTASEGDVLFSVVSVADFDDHLAEIVVGQGVDIEYGQSTEEGEEENERLTFAASADVCAKIAAEYKAWLENDVLADMDDTSIQKITISDDFSAVEFRVNERFEDTFDSLVVLGYYHPMTELQMLSGRSEDDVSVTLRVVNDDTGSVISETTMPDDLRATDTE